MLEDCRLPGDAVLPEVRGLRGPLSCLNEARFGIVLGSMGAARACFESALEYATTRVQFDRPIGGFQLTQQKLADMAGRAVQGHPAGPAPGPAEGRRPPRPRAGQPGQAQQRPRGAGHRAGGRTILGANGITLEYPVIRHANNLESVLTYEGTSEIHTLILGQAITGLAAFT